MHRRRSVPFLVALTAAAAVLTPAPASAANSTLTVNAGSPFRPVSHVGAGGLYALAENNRPADTMLLPLKLHTLTQPSPRVGQRPNGQPPGGDALVSSCQQMMSGSALLSRAWVRNERIHDSS